MAAMAFACFSFNIKLGVKLYYTCVQYLCYMLRCTVLMLYVKVYSTYVIRVICSKSCEQDPQVQTTL